MVYIRGQSNDYDNWAQLGNRGWSYEDVLPVFRDLETNANHHDAFHGARGELHVEKGRHLHPLSQAFLAAAVEAGLPYNPDFNGGTQEGVGVYQTTTHGGRRWSSAKAFLNKAEKRGNLTVRTETRVARVSIEAGRCVGVQLEDGTLLSAGQEVILSAGGIETPRLLQLSGIGDGEELRGHGIPVVADLKGVGENFQDHMQSTVQGETHDPISILGQDKGLKGLGHLLTYLASRGGLMSSNLVECGGFADVSDMGVPDTQLHMMPVMVGHEEENTPEVHGLTIGPCYLRPKSRGTVKLRSARAQDRAIMVTNVLKEEEDLDGLVRGVKLSIRILEAPSLARLIKRRALPEPGIETSDAALRDFIRDTAYTVYHPSGTAKMGPATDRMAVVDSQLRVHGVKGLRVADASIMPTLVSGNTNAPCMMIGERCARFIMGRDKTQAVL
jgi:choline dehydrogenase-like flavoprotein